MQQQYFSYVELSSAENKNFKWIMAIFYIFGTLGTLGTLVLWNQGKGGGFFFWKSGIPYIKRDSQKLNTVVAVDLVVWLCCRARSKSLSDNFFQK